MLLFVFDSELLEFELLPLLFGLFELLVLDSELAPELLLELLLVELVGFSASASFWAAWASLAAFSAAAFSFAAFSAAKRAVSTSLLWAIFCNVL